MHIYVTIFVGEEQKILNIIGVFVNILALVIRQANYVFSAQNFIVICSMSGCIIHLHIIS